MNDLFDPVTVGQHPLDLFRDFLSQEAAHERARRYESLRFVGYVLDIGFDTLTLITSDPFKEAVGGVPRNSLLLMAPVALSDAGPLHFTLLRVLESAPTPLCQSVQQTHFELQKRAMPELDVFTQSELQWGALKAAVLGMFYPHPDREGAIEFSGDLHNFASAHKYRVYAPTAALLDLIVNALVPEKSRFALGDLRLTECRLQPAPSVRAQVSTLDFAGCRTALFGKTRLGKSNVVKLIAQSFLETRSDVGQLIFDADGEYANANGQDGNRSLAGAYPSKCHVYALTQKAATPSRPLKLNFYTTPESALPILGSLLAQSGRCSGYIENFASVELPALADVRGLTEFGEKTRALRKLQMYWAILRKAGFAVDETALLRLAPSAGEASGFNPGFTAGLRSAAFKAAGEEDPPPPPDSLDALVNELEIINGFRRASPKDRSLLSSSGKPLFEADDVALLGFLDPRPGCSGPMLLHPFHIYHDPRAGDFVREILRLLEQGKTVILDLGNAHPTVMRYFSDELTRAVFNHQVDRFSNNRLGERFVQLYFEEAHNLFPRTEDPRTIYSRLAKEGAKYHLGMVYSTQSPTTINSDLLAQTENFFVAHLSSREEAAALAKLNVAYEGMTEDILSARTPGFIRMLTRSHRFVVPVQARRFEALAA